MHTVYRVFARESLLLFLIVYCPKFVVICFDASDRLLPYGKDRFGSIAVTREGQLSTHCCPSLEDTYRPIVVIRRYQTRSDSAALATRNAGIRMRLSKNQKPRYRGAQHKCKHEVKTTRLAC